MIHAINQPILEANEQLNKVTRNPVGMTPEKIAKLKKAANQEPIGKINYQAWDADETIWMTELWGNRRTQEDATSLGQLPVFHSLSDDEAKHVLSQTPLMLHKLLVQNGMGVFQGSTLCSVIIQGNKIFTTNVGDSTALLCIINQKGNVSLRPLNTLLHNPKKRLINPVYRTTLALSRAIGDTVFESAGLSHDADVYIDSVTIPENGRVFVINACDGLINNAWLPMIKAHRLIRSLYQSDKNMTCRELSKQLAEEALRLGSSDNITVMATEIKADDITARHMDVFDGHGGDQVSGALSSLFEPVLTNQILLTQLFSAQPELKEKLELMLLHAQQGKRIASIKEHYEFFNDHVIPLMKAGMEITDVLSLYQVIEKILAIRTTYNPDMPSPFSEAFDAFKTRDQRKSAIKHIESSLITELAFFPKHSATDIIDNLLTHLKNAKKAVKGNTVVFTQSTLANIIKLAQTEVSAIRDQLLAVQKNSIQKK